MSSDAQPPSTQNTAPASLKTFSDGKLSFRYPKAWRRYTWQFSTSFSDSIVYLSTGVEHNPCTTTHSDDSETIRCSAPIREVEPSGVLILWTHWSIPGHHLQTLRGTPTRIADHPAKLTIGEPAEWCAKIGGERSVTASIALPETSWTEMDACLRGPNLSATQKQVQQLLASARYANATPRTRKTIKLHPGHYSFLIGAGNGDSAAPRLLTGDRIICLTDSGAPAGGASVPERGHSVGSSSGVRVEVTMPGRVKVTCPAHPASA